MKESELASLFGKLKYKENLINSIYDTNKEKTLVPATPLSTAFFSTSIIQDFQDSPDDEEDTRSNQEYMNDLEEEYQARSLLAKSKRFFKKGTQRFSSAKATDQTECHKCGKKGHFIRDCWSKTSVPSYQSPFQPKLLHSSEHKPEPRHTKDFKAKYNKVKAKLALLSSSASAPKEVSSDDNEVTKVKALMALADEEIIFVSKESARNGEWIKISIKKVHTLLEMEDNDDRKSYLDYLYQLLVSKQAKLDFLTMQHVNTEILKENQNLRNELKELTFITEAWLNSSNKVNQCISKQIPTQKKKILGIDQLTEDTSSPGPKDLVFVKSSANNSEVSITGSNKPKLSEAEDSTLSNHDTDEHPLPPLEKLTGAEPVSGPKTTKSILKSKSTFKAENLKGIIINEPSSAPARGNKGSLAFITNSAPVGKLKNVKMEDDPPLAIEMRELNELKLQINKNKSSYFRNKNSQQVPPNALQNKYKTQFKMNCELCGQNNHLSENCYEVLFCKNYDHDTHGHNMIISLRRGIKPRNPQHVTKNCETCGSNVHTTSDHNDIEWFRKRESLQAKKVKSFKASKTESSSAPRSNTPTKSEYSIVPPDMLGPDLNGKAVNKS
ncbi:retrovirus-related pol polyprotein from transposon TNT 1-94 [Tanacetum coccineum]